MNQNAISAFEYITILISIILGLGITQILASVADVFHSFKKVKLYIPHTIWVIIILFLHIQEWFIIYELKEYPVWKLPTFLFIILYPITLFIIAKLLFPRNDETDLVNLKEYYLNNFSIIFLLFCISILLSILFNIFFLNTNFLNQAFLILPLLFFATIAILKIKQEWVHYAASIITLIIFIATVCIEYNNWYVK